MESKATETIEIPMTTYLRYLDMELLFDALHTFGVEEWEKYEDARQLAKSWGDGSYNPEE